MHNKKSPKNKKIKCSKRLTMKNLEKTIWNKIKCIMNHLDEIYNYNNKINIRINGLEQSVRGDKKAIHFRMMKYLVKNVYPKINTLHQKFDLINSRINSVEKSIQDHALGVQNMYNEFKKLSPYIANAENLTNKIKYMRSQVKALDFKMAQWYTDIHYFMLWAKKNGFDGLESENKKG